MDFLEEALSWVSAHWEDKRKELVEDAAKKMMKMRKKKKKKMELLSSIEGVYANYKNEPQPEGYSKQSCVNLPTRSMIISTEEAREETEKRGEREREREREKEREEREMRKE